MDKQFLDNNLLSIIVVFFFFLFYFFVIFENILKIKKSISAIFFSGIILFFLFFLTNNNSDNIVLNHYFNHFLLEFSGLFFFLFVAMVFINSIRSFGFFDFIKFKIFSNKMSYKKIYWTVGFLSFFISPFADNLTTALLMSSVILSLNDKNSDFVNLSFINIVIASNSGGVFSPFGDLTTLMIWQSGVLKFNLFFYTFFSSFASFFIPSLIISFYLPVGSPSVVFLNKCGLKSGFFYVIFIFFFTLFLTVFLQVFFNLSSVFGMMFGLSFLFIFELICKKKKIFFSLKLQINKIEWDTLFFFYGIMLIISALSSLGVLNYLSFLIYENSFNDSIFFHKHTVANFLIGILSAFIDNIPITFAILNMNLNMDSGQWLLVTYAVGTGGSLFSFGSAAGVALMGKSKYYTFFSHFKWTWCVMLGYVLGIFVQLFVNNFFLFF